MCKSYLHLGIFLLCISALATGCRGETIPLDLAGMGEVAISKLEENGIWYRRIEGGMVEVNRSDAPQVMEIMDALLADALPPGRHNAFNAIVQPILKRRLEDEGVEFSSVCVSGSEFIVWEAGASATVYNIADGIRQSLLERSELDGRKSRRPAVCP